MTNPRLRLIFLSPTHRGRLRRRCVGGVGAAPAPVPRKHGPGRRRVTVRPHYGGPPFNGLDGTGRAGRKLRARAGEEPAVRVPEATVPRNQKEPRWSAGRRARCLKARAARKRGGQGAAPPGAPPPLFWHWAV